MIPEHGTHQLKWLLNETYRLRESCYENGCIRNGVPISKWICYSYSISIWNLKGCSIASTDTAFSQHRLWITPIIIRQSRYGVGSSALVMAPLTSKGNWKGCYWCYRYCSRYHRGYASFSIFGGWYRLLLLLLGLFDPLLLNRQLEWKNPLLALEFWLRAHSFTARTAPSLPLERISNHALHSKWASSNVVM